MPVFRNTGSIPHFVANIAFLDGSGVWANNSRTEKKFFTAIGENDFIHRQHPPSPGAASRNLVAERPNCPIGITALALCNSSA